MKKTGEKNMNLMYINNGESVENFYSDLKKMYSGQLKHMLDKEIASIIDNSKYNGAVVRVSQMNDTDWNDELTVFIAPNKWNWNNVYELKLTKKNGKLVIKSANKELVKENNVKNILKSINSILAKAYDKYLKIHTAKAFFEDRKKMYSGQLKHMYDKEMANIIDNSKYNDVVVRISQMNDTDWNDEFTVFVVPNKRNWNNVYELKLTKENGKLVIKSTNKDLTNSDVEEIFDKVYAVLEKAYDKYAFIHCNNSFVKSSEKVMQEKQDDVSETIIVKIPAVSESIKKDKLNSYRPKVKEKIRVQTTTSLLN